MPGCVLRAFGRDFQVDEFLAECDWDPCEVWRLGEQQATCRPPDETSGFNLVISEAPGTDLERQVEDAIGFLVNYRDELERLSETPGVDHILLDFGITRRNVPLQSDFLPGRLVRLAGRFGLGIELSQYPGEDAHVHLLLGLRPGDSE